MSHRRTSADTFVPKRTDRRRGAVTVEFALTVPIVFLLLFGAIECLYVNMIRCTAENAAYEGARRGIIPGATVADVRAETQSVLNAVGVDDQRVTVSPSPIQPDTPEITVTIEIPLNSNTLVSAKFFRDDTLRRTCTLQRERLETSVAP